MIGTYNGASLLRCDWSYPTDGAFFARVEVAEEPLAEGVLALGSRSFRGVAVGLQQRNGLWAFRFVTGRNGWGNELPEAAFAGPVALRDVVRITAATVGETVDVAPVAAGEVPSYLRPAGPASRVLASPWYVGEDGVTRVGYPRTGKAWDRESALVKHFDHASAHGSGEEVIAPGDSALADEATRITFASTWGNLAGEFTADVDGVPTVASAVRAAVASRAADPGAREYELASGTWRGVANRSADLDPANVTQWIFPGSTIEFDSGARVIIAFADGDRTQPRIVAAISQPRSVRLRAGSVAVGEAPAPVARAAEVVSTLAALAGALDAQASTLTAAGSAPVTSAALGAILSALSSAFKSTLDKIPTSTFTAD